MEHTQLLQALDQLQAGAANTDPASLEQIRRTLASIVRDGSPELLLLVVDGLVKAVEGGEDARRQA